ncbi:MAG: glycosyltransferase family A protein [Candidatus Hydrogenedentes bacterium]|nr:glycosyltransferase family A protein [Candidatus Hydrogenedentota bacterium]
MVRNAEAHVEAGPTVALRRTQERLSPVRGLVLAQNLRGERFAIADLSRWLRINRVVFKTEKVDILTAEGAAASFAEYLDCAQGLDMRASLRTDCEGAPPDLKALRDLGLLDVFLTPRRATQPGFQAWLERAHEAGLKTRVQLHVPLHKSLDGAAYAQRYKEAGVTAVNLAAYDAFVRTDACRDKEQSAGSIARMIEFAQALESKGIECNILRVPFCSIPKEHWLRVVNNAQFYLDHQQYRKDSYELALRLAERGPVVGGKVLSILLGRYTLFKDPIDSRLLPWLLESPWLRARAIAWHKLTRHLRLARHVPKPVEDSEQGYEKALQKKRRDTMRELGPVCGICSLRHVCDRESTELSRALPGIKAASQDGEVVMDPMWAVEKQAKYYDPIDDARAGLDTARVTLAAKADDTVTNLPPDLEIDSFDYSIEGQWAHQLPGGVRWHGFTNAEKLSTPLAKVDPPFTLSVIFGGGIAEYIGFSFGRDCKLVCAMEGYKHRVVLHVEPDGSYVLLRDGRPVHPREFEGSYYVPLRLGDRLEPRISIWNIDTSIVTQNVALWSEALRQKKEERRPKFSIVTVCVRYARRLQAVLQSIAHQEGVDLPDIEVIVAYVPDIDVTEDVLDSLRLTHPELRIHRSTFTEQNASAKGFIINETLKKASGDWVVLLDADTLLPPNLLAKVLEQTEGNDFLVPDGRKLLTRETTAKVLQGDIRPWECWDELVNGAGEFRYREMGGVPIGFCQVVRRSCFDKVSYYEAEHFEGADWQFSVDMREEFGRETRLSGVPVLHLDHGGSKWYGTERHF